MNVALRPPVAPRSALASTPSSPAPTSSPKAAPAASVKAPTPTEKTNVAVVDGFYSAFERRDGPAMAAAYAPSATFSDPVFPDLKDGMPGAMWRMLCGNKELRVRHEIVKAEGDVVVARWVANYKFSKTGRDVENHVTSTLRLKDGKIVEQQDAFDMRSWLRQAYGPATLIPFAEPVLTHLTRRAAASKLQAFVDTEGARD